MSGNAKPAGKNKKETAGFNDPAQSKRFVDAARKAEADETEEGADKAFKKVAPTKRARQPPQE